MRATQRNLGVAVAVLFVLAGCGKDEPGAGTATKAAPPKVVVEPPPPPYTYAAPVKGHYKEVNAGDFDLVDGIAYATPAGTVVYVTDKPIASPLLAAAACPATQARALSQLRNVNFLEVTLNPAGRSKYFTTGASFGGGSREEDVGGRYWSAKLGGGPGRATGSVRHGGNGGFEFDLPVVTPKQAQFSESERSDGKRGEPTAPKLDEQAMRAAYQALHAAAMKKDLKALLAAQGFAPAEVASIRGLAGIDADFAVYANRFLQPGTVTDFASRTGSGYVKSEGTNAQGKKFANYYHFTPCGERLVLTGIAENPQ
jgi:hypothetical protein